MKPRITIGSRGSQLALWQTDSVKTQLENRFPETIFDVRIIKTTGDAILDTALAKIGDKGLFTRQIENALLDREIDLAVHSLKDLPTTQPENLSIAAVSARELPNDVLISGKYNSIDELPRNAKVATGSLRRRSQLLHYRPDLEIIEIRGNVPTRIEKLLNNPDLDGLILAFAGIHRLKLDSHIKQIIPFEVILPAVGQGAMAVEIRTDDRKISEMLDAVNDSTTAACVTAERAFLQTLEGGCQVPIGASAFIEKDQIHLEGFVGSLNGKSNLRGKISGKKLEANQLGVRLARILIEQGANEILEHTRRKVERSEEEVI